MNTLILGVGAFGVPVITHIAKNHPEERFFAHEKNPEVLEFLMREHRHPHFFSEKTFPKNVVFIDTLTQILPTIDCIILIIPNQFVASAIDDIQPFLKAGVVFLNLSKGIDNRTLHTVSDTLREKLGNFPYHYGVLSGGMIASELMDGAPLGAQIGVSDMAIAHDLKTLFQSDTLDIEITQTPKDIELFSALKNIFALYSGYIEGRGYGNSTLGYHFVGLWKDMQKLIQMLGGTGDMDFGQYALGGDLIATCFGSSRNRYFGKLVGSGKSVEEVLSILKSEKKHAEGYETLKGVREFIRGKGDFPEIEKVIEIFLDDR